MLALGIEIKSTTDSVGHQILLDALYAVVSPSYKYMGTGAD